MKFAKCNNPTDKMTIRLHTKIKNRVFYFCNILWSFIKVHLRIFLFNDETYSRDSNHPGTPAKSWTQTRTASAKIMLQLEIFI